MYLCVIYITYDVLLKTWAPIQYKDDKDDILPV